ncbi:hypothetical protein FRC07_000555 [Ceratobasidium sp. 392]|nr:hypothetical protein FRC07_000555 [Ceratobasidium sp. 392]
MVTKFKAHGALCNDDKYPYHSILGLIMIYNDAYATLVGPKHSSIWGQKASIAWDDQWSTVAPIAEHYSLFFTSFTESGHPREVYHTWNWTPVKQEDGFIGGILNSTYDTTQRVITERRARFITDFVAQLAEAKSHDEVSQVLLNVLSEYDTDFPFAALYLCESNEMGARPYLKGDTSRKSRNSEATKSAKVTLKLVGVVGIPDDHPAAPQSVEYILNFATLQQLDSDDKSPASLDQDTATMVSTTGESHSLDPSTLHNDSKQPRSPSNGTWPFPALFSSGKTEIVSPLPPNLTEGPHERSFGDRPNSAALIPIPVDFPGKRGGPNLPHVVLVVGLNARLTYDESYEKWLESIAVAFSSRLMVALQMEVDEALARERDRLDAAQSRFFTSVSHELRTPLTLIQAPLEQLAELKELAPSAKSKLDLATRNVERLRRLVESILDVSKLEAGHITGRFRPVQLDQITADMASLFRGVAEKKGIALHVDVQTDDIDAKPSTYIDIQLWEKIFYNLLSNAFKYTKAGTVAVSVSYDSTSAFLHVSDTGIGIPAAKQGEIFELFHRVDELPVEGSGVGLAVAKELVNLHGGKLSVSSRAESEHTSNTGSTFTVELPLGSNHLPPEQVTNDKRVVSLSDIFFEKSNYWTELDTLAPELETAESEETSASTFFNRSDVVLVVDNDTDMRNFLRSIFAPYMTVLEAHDGVEALEVVQSSDVNLILRQALCFPFVPWFNISCSDILMPRLTGPEFLSKLRNGKKTMFIPVIFVTAITDNTGFLTGQTEGIVDCITKPFNIRDLLARSHMQLQIGKRRIKLENDFTERSSELQTLTNLSPVGIFRADTAGQLTYTNPKWYQMTGYDSSRDKDEWLDRQPVSAILQNAEVVRTNMKVLRTALAQCSINNDAYVPTMQILGELDDDIQALNNIIQCGLSQERIANDILSLSKIQLDALPVVPVAFELKSRVEQILTVFNKELASKSISLTIEFGPGINTPTFAVVFTDLGRLSQIITNLMSNAIRFTEMNTRKREIKVFVDVSSDPPVEESCLPPPIATQPRPLTDELQAIYIYMSVQDSGPGLQKEDLDLFQQGSNDHHVFGGSGLDLFVCRHLCNLLSGRVEVHNSSNGATLRFFIRATKPPPPSPGQQTPASSGDPEAPSSTTRAEFSRRPSEQEIRVLVTEDNKVNQAVVMRQMKRAGFTAALASNGAEAIQAISQAQSDDSPFDVILMDLQMPVMQVGLVNLWIAC